MLLIATCGRARAAPSATTARLRVGGTPLGPPCSPCAVAPLGLPRCPPGHHRGACPLRLWLGCGSLFSLRHYFAVQAARETALELDRIVRKLSRKSDNPFTQLRDTELLAFARWQSELSVGVTLQAKAFEASLDNDMDKNYAHAGQFTVTYRRALYAKPRNWFERRMAWVLYVYKVGVDTSLLRQIFTGGWLALELNAFPYTNAKENRLLVRVAAAGGHSERAKDYVSGAGRSVFHLNAAVSAEAAWTVGPVTGVIRTTALPRYREESFGTRVESEIGLEIRLSTPEMSRALISEITLMPKVMHMYHSFPLIEEIRGTDLPLELQRQIRAFQLADLRHVLVAYCSVLFRLKM